MNAPPVLFDRTLVRRRRTRAALQAPPLDYLARRASEFLVERLDDVRRSFPEALAIACHPGALDLVAARRIARLVACDNSAALLQASSGPGVVADEEALPFADARFDLVLAGPVLHWVNDLPGTLSQIARSLRPDGLLLAALPGAQTLVELRESLLEAEIEVRGGAALRVGPFADVRDVGGLLQRAGFALPVVDVETVQVTFDHPLRLLDEVRRMGQANPLRERPRPLDRQVVARLIDVYRNRYSTGAGRVVATFQFLMLSGWRPDPSQPLPQARGSGRKSLARDLAEYEDDARLSGTRSTNPR